MSITVHEQKILIFTGGSHLPREKQRECKKESVRDEHLIQTKLGWGW